MPFALSDRRAPVHRVIPEGHKTVITRKIAFTFDRRYDQIEREPNHSMETMR